MFLSKIGEVYYLFYSDEHNVRRKVSTKCRKKSDAFCFLQRFKKNEYEQKRKQRTILFSSFVKEYSTYAKNVLTEKTFRTYQTAFREFLRIEGDRYLHTIGIREIENFLSIKKGEASEWGARSYYIALASAFEKAVQWSYLFSNPFRKVQKPKVREILPVFFSEMDFKLFLSTVAEKDFRELCITGLLTGLRLGELLALRWQDVDFSAKVILVQNSDSFTTKSKKNRVVPMSEALCRILQDRRGNVKTESDAVFYDQYGKKLLPSTVSHQFKRYVRRAGLNEKLHFHSLRHTFASWLAQGGTSLYMIKDLLGHSDMKTTQIYAHLQPDSLRSEVDKISLSLN